MSIIKDFNKMVRSIQDYYYNFYSRALTGTELYNDWSNETGFNIQNDEMAEYAYQYLQYLKNQPLELTLEIHKICKKKEI